MARGPKQHLKRLYAPKDWFLSKLSGVFAPRPHAGPHKLRESLPLLVVIRNRLKYALNAREARMVLRQKFVSVDGRPRTDSSFPAGFQDVITIAKTGDRFRVLYDVKGRFTLTRIDEAEANIKLCKVTTSYTGTHRVPVIVTHDGHRIRYADPTIRHGDTLVYNLQDKKVQDVLKFRAGKIAMITRGANRGRVGEITDIERHPGAFDIVHVKDAADNIFATRAGNVFVIANNASSIPITLPKRSGVRQDTIEERDERLASKELRAQAAANAQKSRRSKK
jgi:small subunit ribosomal protein S4e